MDDTPFTLSADEANSYLDYTPETDPQVQRAVSAAQQLSGTTTVAGANDSASSAAASEAADSTAADAETAPETDAPETDAPEESADTAQSEAAADSAAQ